MKKQTTPSEFKHLKEIEYFDFEEDFIENNVRCIPMIVRFKMDAVGIKLKLAEWSRFESNERVALAVRPISDAESLAAYRRFLMDLITKRTKNEPTLMPIENSPAWSVLHEVPALVQQKLAELQLSLSQADWTKLSDLQRFTLVKLCRPGHENKNFPIAMAEFGLN